MTVAFIFNKGEKANINTLDDSNTFFLCLKPLFDFVLLIAWSKCLMRKAGGLETQQVTAM